MAWGFSPSLSLSGWTSVTKWPLLIIVSQGLSSALSHPSGTWVATRFLFRVRKDVRPFLALSIAAHVFLAPPPSPQAAFDFSTSFCGKSLCLTRRQLSACYIGGELAACSTLKHHSFFDKSRWEMELEKITQIPRVRSEGLQQCCQSGVKRPLGANGPG